MKKLLMIALMLVTTIAAMAQDDQKKVANDEFFIGRFEILVEGLPSGDAKMLVVVKKDAEGKLEGTIGGTDGSATNKMTKVEIEGKTLNFNFLGGGYDVPVYLDREDDDTVVGSMNDMFDITGKKLPEAQEEQK